MVQDVKKAYFYGTPTRKIFIRPPAELGLPKHIICRLKRCRYGTRGAGSIWEQVYADALLELGFKQGTASPVASTMLSSNYLALFTGMTLHASVWIALWMCSRRECNNTLR